MGCAEIPGGSKGRIPPAMPDAVASTRQREKKGLDELDLARVETRGADYIERARALAPLLEDAADEIEAQRQLPERVADALVEGGFFKLLLPRSLGGAERPSRLCPGARGNRQGRAFDGVVPGAEFRLFDVGTLSRPGGGARDLRPGARHSGLGAGSARRRRGVAVEGGIRVTGRWGFATGSRHASWLGAHVPIFEEDGSPRLNRTAARSCAPCCSPNRAPRSSTIGRSSACAAPAATAIRSRICSCRRNTPARATTRPSGARGPPL